MTDMTPPTPPADQGRGLGKILLTVFGSIGALVAVALLVGALVLGIAHTQRDADGFFTTSTERHATGAYALTHEGVRIGDVSELPNWVDERFGTVRVNATAGERTPLFVGIARTADVERYLHGVAHEQVADFDAARRSRRRDVLGRLDGQHRHASARVGARGGHLVGRADERRCLSRRRGRRRARRQSRVPPGGSDPRRDPGPADRRGERGDARLRPREAGSRRRRGPRRARRGVPGGARGAAGRVALALALAREVAPRDPALRRAGVPLGRVPRPDGGRLLRDPRHRPLPTAALRVQRRRAALDVAGRLLRGYAPHRSVPAA